MLGALPFAVFTSDSAGNVDYLNPAAEALTGHSREAAFGKPVNQVLPLASIAEGRPLDSPAIACLRLNTPIGPMEAKSLAGSESRRRVLDVTAAPIHDTEGAVAGAILIAWDVTRARRAARRLTRQATHDALTGLVNRTEFERRLTHALASASKGESRHALGFLDLDGFKRINDSCGHQAGDELLRELSGLLRRRMRARDTLARLGGDEFGILLEHCSRAEALRLADLLRRTIADHPFSCGGRTFSIGVSVGIVPVRGGGSTTTQLLCAADAACYEAKRRGGNRVQYSGIEPRGCHIHKPDVPMTPWGGASDHVRGPL